MQMELRAKMHFFTLVPADRMKLITPSQWLADLVGESYLRDYPVEVRHNTIDTSIFKPTPSDFRERYGIGDRFMILGVASPWTERKGLSDFVHLANDLDSEKFAIVLVGLSGKQIKELQKQPVAIHKVDNPRELAGAYTTADVFVHPGVEETFGMTVAEAQACETHVIVTQGSACAEIADRDNTSVVPADLSTLKATIVKLAGGVWRFLCLGLNPRSNLRLYILQPISSSIQRSKIIIQPSTLRLRLAERLLSRMTRAGVKKLSDDRPRSLPATMIIAYLY